jgi:uncharacterized membrane protein
MHELMRHSSDVAAFVAFMLAWVAYEPILRGLARGRHVINADMKVVRRAWMTQMINRPQMRLLDSQLVGHALNSASFFASSNLILIAGSAGVLFGDEGTFRVIESTPLLAKAPPLLFSFKLALIAVTLARGLLSFIWAIRQLNYCVAVIGAAPREAPPERLNAYAEAATAVLNPALSAFNAGVRAYYFALAAAAWLFGPMALASVTLGAVGLLAWRQAASPAAGAVRTIRALLEAEVEVAATTEDRPIGPQA